ncbi:hypothetical protein GCM10008959_39600 [Deinococcus seoulensis]|uniref:HNH nuclease domain-containing protein n=1 Tax=Deinococcus seoulensis TaxID=1837379 RepID=A0ABQ2RY96_9DEIO|nr:MULTISPECIES: HNH endonuclease signature motif containing protein [Deinococcus]MCD0163153.1 HNH endonuclease [Deinococcus sp. 6YEL10]MCD0165671.1 HNH endonuclease [Deinococcus sp. 12RED42]MCD0175733.1 HNH endonuclease [Deinococcus sp. 14RED07]GGR74415.1 hypothetical protein GCM10008959_39600 [Deinococcus seoulensis]
MAKQYARTTDKATGRPIRLHRMVAQECLGRPLLPGEVVHHRDGNSLNNAPENLLVLPSQRYHAHLECCLRRERRGQPMLFPELLEGATTLYSGSLFENIYLGR